jgi:hypothetical protein
MKVSSTNQQSIKLIRCALLCVLQEKSNLLKSKVFKQVSSSQGNQVPNAVQKTLPIVIPANAGIQ